VVYPGVRGVHPVIPGLMRECYTHGYTRVDESVTPMGIPRYGREVYPMLYPGTVGRCTPCYTLGGVYTGIPPYTLGGVYTGLPPYTRVYIAWFTSLYPGVYSLVYLPICTLVGILLLYMLPTVHPWVYYHPHTPLVTVLHSWCATAVLR